MSLAETHPWTADQFLSWARRQEGRFEYDGVRPVAMTGGGARHNRIMMNIHAALRVRLRGPRCSVFGPDLAVRTLGERLRYPDALVTCATFEESEQIAPDVVIVFEVSSPDSGRRDRIEKVREYAAVASIRRYVIVESATSGLLVLHRKGAEDPWTATALTVDDMLALPELGVEIPVAEIYENVRFAD